MKSLVTSFLAIPVFLFISYYGQTKPVIKIEADVSQQNEKLKPFWAYFGYDEPNYTYMKDGRKLLTELAALSPVPVYVRTHNLLTTGDGTAALKWGSTNAYTEDSNGNPVYNWKITDSIFDTYISRGIKPIAEIGFMPEALSTHPRPYRHYWKPGKPYDEIYTGWSYPPTNYNKWRELVYQWVLNCVKRYGHKEVATWWWEVWNEPNIPYWHGTMEEYFKLYDYAADAVKKACPDAKVSGPTSTGPGWDKAAFFLEKFLQHCADGENEATGKKGAPLDYITFHAKGSPKVVNGHVQMNMMTQLHDVARGFEISAASPFKNLPIIIGECDPEGCAACGMTTNPENAYRNGTMYSSYTAASFAHIYELAKRYSVNLEGAVSWSFEFENQRWFDGFRDLATNGIDKPVLNVFRMYGLMNGYQLNAMVQDALPLDSVMLTGTRNNKRDINALASADEQGAAVMVWNYNDDDVPAVPASVQLTLKNIPSKKVMLKRYAIDKEYSNAYELWKKLGLPQQVSATQYSQLEKAGMLAEAGTPRKQNVGADKALSLNFNLPAQGVALIKIVYE